MIDDIIKTIQENVKDTDIEWILCIRSKSENKSASMGHCTAEELFSMLAHAAEVDPAVRLAVEATHVYLEEQDLRNMQKENPGVSMNGLGPVDTSNQNIKPLFPSKEQ